MTIIYDTKGNQMHVIDADDLYFANLNGLDLRNADFRNKKMVHACLHNAILDGADFRGADLRDAYLGDTSLDCAIIDDTTLLPIIEDDEDEEFRKRPCWM